MEDVVNLITFDASPSEISDSIKNALYTKAAQKIDELRPMVASTIFGEDDENTGE